MNILFICRYNRFRSRVAEAYFKKVNKNHSVKSAGLIQGNPLDKTQVGVAKKYGLKIKGNPQGLSSKLLAWHDLKIVVANDVPISIFKKSDKEHKKKTLLWKIPDEYSGKPEKIGELVEKIIKHVDKFNKELKC
jgi:protein-tyrosine-phosphatase